MTRPFFGDLLAPPFDDVILGDYPDSSVNFRSQLEAIGIGSTYLTLSLGTMFLLIFITCVGLLFSYLIKPLSCLRFVKRFSAKLDKWLKWNWTIRVFMEGLMEIAFCTIITIMHVSPETFGNNFNLAFAYGLGIATLIFPIFLLAFYCKNFERMASEDDEEFDEKFGAPHEGLRQD